MSKPSYLKRLRTIDRLITSRSTGNASEFARQLGISRSQLFGDLQELRELGAPIFYSRTTQTFYYKHPTTFSLYFNPLRSIEIDDLEVFDERKE